MNNNNASESIIFTNAAKCQDCYRCVRACPVKAIKMENGQASVDPNRCILCGICIKECPQGAKSYRKDIYSVQQMINNKEIIAISLAPSFASAFPTDIIYKIPGILKHIGFSYVAETAVGAYYVAQASSKLINNKPNTYIASSCPAVVNYIEKYNSQYISNLIPVVSPMIAHAKELRKKFGENCKIVFAGPCIAKKAEAQRAEYINLVDAVLTFEELNELIDFYNINIDTIDYSDFDETPSGYSRLFALNGGFNKTAEINDDLLSPDIVTASGFYEINQALDYINQSSTSIMIEPLFCKLGCINGPGFSDSNNIFNRKRQVIEFHKALTTVKATNNIELSDVELSESFSQVSINNVNYSENQILEILSKTGSSLESERLNCGACGYNSCREKAVAVINQMASVDMCIPYMRKLAEIQKDKIIETSPNGIVILDNNFNILLINKTFEQMFICSKSIIGKPISYLIDPEPFVKLSTTDQDKIESTVKYETYNIVCRQIAYKLIEDSQYVGIFVNITANIQDKDRFDSLRRKTIKQAQELLNHQMNLAQSVAKLLGESTAKGEELVSNLMKLAQDEAKDQKSDSNSNWLSDIYS